MFRHELEDQVTFKISKADSELLKADIDKTFATFTKYDYKIMELTDESVKIGKLLHMERDKFSSDAGRTLIISMLRTRYGWELI